MKQPRQQRHVGVRGLVGWLPIAARSATTHSMAPRPRAAPVPARCHSPSPARYALLTLHAALAYLN
jgi:hypothetical protein